MGKIKCIRCIKGTIGACARVIQYRKLKEEPGNMLNMINAIKWINARDPNLFTKKCKYIDLLDALEHKDTFVDDVKPKDYKIHGEKRRLASCSWTSAVFVTLWIRLKIW